MDYKTAKLLGTGFSGLSYVALATCAISGNLPMAIGGLAAAGLLVAVGERFSRSARFVVGTTYPEQALPAEPQVGLFAGPLSRDILGRASVRIRNNVQEVLVDQPDGKTAWIAVAALGGSPEEAKAGYQVPHIGGVTNLLAPQYGSDPSGIFADPTLADWVGYDGKKVTKTWDKTGRSIIIPIAASWRDGSPAEFKIVDQFGNPLKGSESQYLAAGKKLYYASMRVQGDGIVFRTVPMAGALPVEVEWRTL